MLLNAAATEADAASHLSTPRATRTAIQTLQARYNPQLLLLGLLKLNLAQSSQPRKIITVAGLHNWVVVNQVPDLMQHSICRGERLGLDLHLDSDSEAIIIFIWFVVVIATGAGWIAGPSARGNVGLQWP